MSALFKGKALGVYALMPIEEALDYDMLKAALLKRYELTEESSSEGIKSVDLILVKLFSSSPAAYQMGRYGRD